MQFFQLHGFTEMDAAGASLIMSDLVVEFKSESFYKDIIEVKIFTGEISRVGFEIYYSLSVVRNKITVLIARAKTGMVCFNYTERKVTAVPKILKEILLS